MAWLFKLSSMLSAISMPLWGNINLNIARLVWCDISSNIIVRSALALPAACLLHWHSPRVSRPTQPPAFRAIKAPWNMVFMRLGMNISMKCIIVLAIFSIRVPLDCGYSPICSHWSTSRPMGPLGNLLNFYAVSIIDHIHFLEKNGSLKCVTYEQQYNDTWDCTKAVGRTTLLPLNTMREEQPRNIHVRGVVGRRLN
ncbi:uncharacterized protein BJ212DRAFT_1353616 [Suillus subaureus]|uniref:Uncharacterized protein n=1 Tax=Suillus subaureus TaxID=48587 RepID=A0A9P7JE28_9AGAM|nr:uncharacterized protein BJ212DRAFT_1353616 [Suillus subaureus]KAG1816846.1 hypothetical protein BJ212DRAFT_1353616 [Suillus subaureus]